MLDPEIFQEKYETTLKQRQEESFLDEVSEEDRAMWTDVEILTGKDSNNRINKFNNFGKKNIGKKYNTLKSRLNTELQKYIDGKLSRGELEELWDNLFKEANNGNTQLAKLVVDRVYGKQEENVNLKLDGEITFSLDTKKVTGEIEDKNE